MKDINELRLTLSLLGFIILFGLLIFLLWSYGLIFQPTVIPIFDTEVKVGTQPIINPTFIKSDCGYSQCLGINFQQDWKWCNKCGSIYNKNSRYRNCYAGGFHNSSGSGNYQISTAYIPTCNSQSGWKMCIRCACLVYSRYNSQCFDKNAHNLSDSVSYYMCNSNIHGQCSWKWCKKCSTLFYAPSFSKCWDGEPHDGSESIDYQLNTYEEPIYWMNYPAVYSDHICPTMGVHTLNLQACQTLCNRTKGCTAMNYTTFNNKCDLRKCPIGQLPIWYNKGTLGYSSY